MESNTKKDDNRNSSYTCYSGIYANTCFCWKLTAGAVLLARLKPLVKGLA